MISEKLTSSFVFSASQLLQDAQHIVLLTHMSPDGDAMGSSLGFAHYLREKGKASVVNIVPNAFPSFLSWMPGANDVLVYENRKEEADAALGAADLIICSDFNEPKRIGVLGTALTERVEAGVKCLVVDHHLADLQAIFLQECTLCLVDHHAPAACLLVCQLLRAMGAENMLLSLDAATCLYTGLMTDTGNFSFNSNYPELYDIVAELVRQGVDKDAVYNATFNQYTDDRMRLMGFCLYQRMQLFSEKQVALIYLSRKDLYRFNFQSGDAEGIVNLPLQIASVHYSCFMREDKMTPWEKQQHPEAKVKVKISLRSQGNRPVNLFAHDIFHGGGHANASGGEYYGASVLEAVELFKTHFEDYFIVGSSCM